jgi:hypothetical protein
VDDLLDKMQNGIHIRFKLEPHFTMDVEQQDGTIKKLSGLDAVAAFTTSGYIQSRAISPMRQWSTQAPSSGVSI